MKVFVTGGCGYLGACAITHFLGAGHRVTVYDSQLFGSGNLPQDNEQLRVIKADIRDTGQLDRNLIGQDVVIHMAGITSNRCCQLNERTAEEVNIKAFEPLVTIAKARGVRKFILLSSSAAYGSSQLDAIESTPLRPTTLYAKAKARCEDILRQYQGSDFLCVILRPAGIIGYSPRMRFDLTLNQMTLCAVKNNRINVNGGEQKRPHIYIKDLVGLLVSLIGRRKLDSSTYNVGALNATILEAAELVKEVVGHTTINLLPRTDDRNYSLNCDKITHELNWFPSHSIRAAINDMRSRFASGYWKDALTNGAYTNVLENLR